MVPDFLGAKTRAFLQDVGKIPLESEALKSFTRWGAITGRVFATML